MLVYNVPLEEKISDLRRRLEAINKELLEAQVPKISKYIEPMERAIKEMKAAANSLEIIEMSISEINIKLQDSPYYD